MTALSSHPSDILIAFDTIFEQCSIAILQNNTIIHTETVVGGRGQTEIILPMLDKALHTSNVDIKDVKAWAFNRGPGAFSGIRINTAMVQALSVANGAPCIGISSLHALAFMACKQENMTDGMHITAIIDARQKQVYAGDLLVQNALPVAQNEYLLDYDKPIETDIVVGDGVDLVMTDAKKLRPNPTACHIAYLAYPLFLKGKTVTAAHALPVYLRDNAWKTLAQQAKNKK